MPSREPSYVERINGFTGAFRTAVREALTKEQIALYKEGNDKAALRLDEIMKNILSQFPAVEAIEE